MTWTFLLGIVLSLCFAFVALAARRADLVRMQKRVHERDVARREGSAEPQLQHPVIDLSRCLGCGTCVAACPEDGVLDLVHGQALVVRGARCRGFAACERECPVDAIKVTIANLDKRDDVPALSEELEAVGTPGLFLAGEVTAHTLIKTAIDHGSAVASEVARRVASNRLPSNGQTNGVLDLCIVGAGPAGLACALQAKEHGLSFVTLDQADGPGGTVAKYPRQKLVMSQPVDLPLYGPLNRGTYTKEELVELWSDIATRHELPIDTGRVVDRIEEAGEGVFRVHTDSGAYAARNVCVAVGRRGSPQKLEVPGEELAKVSFSLLDARSYENRRIVVVGGGDSAVEAALGLSRQPGNRVTLSYRRGSFFRITAKNSRGLAASVEDGSLELLMNSRIERISENAVDLLVGDPDAGTAIERVTLPNDDVFVMIGGTTPFEFLQHAGVSFDPELRTKPELLGEQGTGLIRALGAALAVSVAALIFALWHSDYYGLATAERPSSLKHDDLRPGAGIGLWLGVASSVCILVNLAYLLRRSPKVRFSLGSLRGWMTSHVATGVLALLTALLHSAMQPRNTVGGRGFVALCVVFVTGVIGRYLYAYVPRAANGRELELSEAKARLAALSKSWDEGQREFRDRARSKIQPLLEHRQWKQSLVARVLSLLGMQRDLRRVVKEIEREGREEGLTEFQIIETVRLTKRAHHAALMTAHFEDLRAVLNTWRYLHRWGAALLVALVVVHVGYALVYGDYFRGGAE